MDPKITVVMATFNSEATVELALKALRAQNYPPDRVEILMVDGGSTDRTLEIGRRYDVRIVPNPRVEPASAKLIGLMEAKGDYLLTCDSDEVTESSDAFRKRVRALQESPNTPVVFPSGYKDPENAKFLSCFINEYGDPFSMFYYRLSKHHTRFIPRLKQSVTVVQETDDYVLFEVAPHQRQPLMENGASGSVMDLHFFRAHFKDLLAVNAHGVMHLFFYLMQTHTRRFALTKNDALVHHSTTDWMTYLRKINYRVINNIFYQQDLGNSGFHGRATYDPWYIRARKYIFLVYAFTLVPVLIDSARDVVRRRDPRFLLTTPLVLYTALAISYYGVLKVLGLKPKVRGYGNTQTAQGAMPGAREIERHSG